MKILFIIIPIILVFTACKKEKIPQSEIDENIIVDYINDNNITAKSTASGLYYQIDSLGSGTQPNANSTVTVAYKGQLVDGQVFDQSSSAGITFSLKNVINGWQEGIPLFKENGAGTLLIPSALGYGAQANGSIPKNSVLIFSIHLISVE
ncbi:peptidylprolyl isomerase [Putridiphycobacter roseus]|uniref:Peptidyl-prolyl cis-trans isomerase n=1 Tax=Putridiphycobacter roseus TaxID=2219161 RepID=A0A2W1NHV5_9FLAO|nr:FKBP-type peptidyl-prolyl cis-trans isomerase [Putridiphycobacter roseus]PZE17506.1 peptidylprolyl isomerase [Putridiphycobacter roseus]